MVRSAIAALVVLLVLGGGAAAWFVNGRPDGEQSPEIKLPTAVVEQPEVEGPIPSLDAMEFLGEVQGWVSISLVEDRYDIQGWAIDRERNQTIKRVLVYLDGVQIAEVEPRVPRPDVPVVAGDDGLESGFDLQLDAAEVNTAKCVRFVAVLRGNRFGRLGVQVRGNGDESQPCWDPALSPA